MAAAAAGLRAPFVPALAAASGEPAVGGDDDATAEGWSEAAAGGGSAAAKGRNMLRPVSTSLSRLVLTTPSASYKIKND